VVCATRNGILQGAGRCESADFVEPGSLAGLVDRVAPDIVVNAAAYTAVDRAEADREAAFRVNADAPTELAHACARRDALLIHYSTDYVFDGRGNRPYREVDPTAPLGVYGASKLAGEEAIRGSGARHMIFRTAWVYGVYGKNFLLTMLRLAKEREELRVVSDQVGTPTPAALIADITAVILRRDDSASGTWHLTANGEISWHGFAEAIFEEACARGVLVRRPRVIPIPTTEYPTPAHRPAYSCLDTTLLSTSFGIELPTWRYALSQTLERAGPLAA